MVSWKQDFLVLWNEDMYCDHDNYICLELCKNMIGLNKPMYVRIYL
jgi:hypothetical protein